MKTFIMALSAIMFSSCMFTGMMGTGGGHRSMNSSEMMTEPVLEKEVLVGDIKVTATFPPLRMDENTEIRVKLIEKKTSQPISGASVTFHAQYAQLTDPGIIHDHANMKSMGTPEQTQGVSFEKELEEGPEPGVYAIQYTSKQPGEHLLMFHITEVGGNKIEPEIIFEAKRVLHSQPQEHSGGMMGMGSTSTTIVVGTMVMGAMMIVMLAAQGRIF